MQHDYILIVDDDLDIRDALTDFLLDLGYPAKSASDGGEALNMLRTEQPPCLVLLDLMMPGMDGYQFRAAQRADPSIAEIPVVVLTAGSQIRADDLLGAPVLPKPMDLDQLAVVLAQHC